MISFWQDIVVQSMIFDIIMWFYVVLVSVDGLPVWTTNSKKPLPCTCSYDTCRSTYCVLTAAAYFLLCLLLLLTLILFWNRFCQRTLTQAHTLTLIPFLMFTTCNCPCMTLIRSWPKSNTHPHTHTHIHTQTRTSTHTHTYTHRHAHTNTLKGYAQCSHLRGLIKWIKHTPPITTIAKTKTLVTPYRTHASGSLVPAVREVTQVNVSCMCMHAWMCMCSIHIYSPVM